MAALLLLALLGASASLGVLAYSSLDASRGGPGARTLARLADTKRRPPGALFARVREEASADFGAGLAAGRFPMPTRYDPTPRQVKR